MAENTPYSDLKAAIKTLEAEQAVKGQVLKDQFEVSIESFNPLNMIKNSISSVTGSSEIRTDLISLLIPLVTGFIGKKAFSRSSRSSVLTKAGIVVLDGLNWYITHNPEVVSAISHFFANLFQKKKKPATAEA
jgi:hypothetical protein